MLNVRALGVGERERERNNLCVVVEGNFTFSSFTNSISFMFIRQQEAADRVDFVVAKGIGNKLCVLFPFPQHSYHSASPN